MPARKVRKAAPKKNPVRRSAITKQDIAITPLLHNPRIIKGTVKKGLGEGARYVAAYKSVLKRKLGFEPYIGTLNIHMKGKQDLRFFDDPIMVPAPKKGLCQVACYPIAINYTLEGAVVIPKKTRNPKSVIEILAPVNLRETLGLKDGDDVVCLRLV
ncbi:MAG: CTP-dependent riboflavin kinase [Nanoarchaeota archaeon]|nr:CTP-dependent riboflavin kinase [Nanoarchaeota archaeon]